MWFFLPFFSNVTLWQTSTRTWTQMDEGHLNNIVFINHSPFIIIILMIDKWQLLSLSIFSFCVFVFVCLIEKLLLPLKEKISQAIHFVCDLFFLLWFLDIFLFHRILIKWKITTTTTANDYDKWNINVCRMTPNCRIDQIKNFI